MSTIKTILTLDELVKFCETHHFTHFSASEQGYPLAVKIPSTFEIDETDNSNSRGMLRLKYKLFHVGMNRNKSNVSEESAKEALPTIAHRPVLASIHQLDNGEWDFHSHDLEEYEDENGEMQIRYIESPVGAFSGYADEQPYIAYDEETGKDYVFAYAYIPIEYTKAAEIIQRKGGSKNSVELHIEEMAYNAKEHYLDLKHFYVNGSTLLGSEKDGTEIEEGMLGSRADIADFKATETNEQLIKAIENLNETLSRFNINDSCGKEVEEVKKELKEEEVQMSLEGLDEPIEEPIVQNDLTDPDTSGGDGDGTGDGTTDETQTTDDTTNSETEGGNTDGNGETQQTAGDGDPSPKIDDDETPESKKIGYSIDFNGAVKEFGLGVSAKLEAVYNLVDNTYGNEDNEWYRCELFEEDGYIEMYGMFSGKCYRQTYEEHDGEFSFTGERVEIFMMFVTQEEKDALESMKSNYSEISEKLRKYEEEPQKMEILDSEEYSLIADAEEFTELKKQESHFDLSVDEVKAKADSILLGYAKSGNFSHQSNNESQANFVQIPVIQKKVGRYGMLFANLENKSN